MFEELFGHGCGSERRARWRFDQDFMNDFFGGRPGGGRSRGRGPGGPGGARVFEQGDLKYVILQLLAEKPRHGYEIIKALEERFGGAYSPSPGTVYPTLTMLEDMGLARAAPEASGKRIYEITEAGHAYLADNRSTVDSIFERIGRFVERMFDAPMSDVHQALGRVWRATYGAASRAPSDPTAAAARFARIQEILGRAEREIAALEQHGAQSSGSSGSAPP